MVYSSFQRQGGAICSSVVRAFAHGAMGRRIDPSCGGPIEEGNVLFNELLNLILWLYGVGHMVKDHSDSRKGSFICVIPQTG